MNKVSSTITLLSVCLFLNLTALYAQDGNTDAEAETQKKAPWQLGWLFNLNGSQAAYSNWSQGGVNSIAATASTVFNAKYTGDLFSNTNKVNLKFGQTRLNGDDVRKTDDLINLSSKFNYFLTNKHYSAFAEIDFRTQFYKGYNEDYTAVISDFMAPGYFTESMGLSYQPTDNFSSQLGLGLKQTIVTETAYAPLYGLSAGDNLRSEGGVTIGLSYDQNIAENISYSGSLNTFTNLNTALSSTDFQFTNEITGKINSYLSTNFQFVMMYDDDITDQLQLKQVLAVGVNVTLM